MSNSETTNNSVHFVLQGKGGVGKSFVSAILAQYFRHTGWRLIASTRNPVNATFAQYQGLGREPPQRASNAERSTRSSSTPSWNGFAQSRACAS